MAFDPDAYLAEGGGVKETPFDPDSYLGIEKPVGTSFTEEISQIPAALKQSFGQPLEAMGETAEVVGFPAVGKGLKESIQEPEGYVTAGQRFMEPQEGEFQIAGFAPQYAPRAIAEQTGQILMSIGARAVGAAAGIPLGPAGVVTGAFLGPALTEAAQIIGPVAKERARNNGYEEPTNEDIAYAAVTAAGSGALNAFGAKYLPGGEKAVGSFAKRLAASFIGEGIPEGLQSFTQQVGETIETEKGIQVSPKQAVGEALIGGAAGAAATTIAAPFTPEQIAEAKITESANKEAENLVIGNDNPQGKAVLANKQKLEQEIADIKQVLSVIESTDPIAQKLKLELKEKEAILAAAQGQVDSIVESADPVAEAEKQQIELDKQIAEKPVEVTPEVTEVVAPITEVTPEVIESVTEVTPTAEVATTTEVTPEVVTPDEIKAIEITQEQIDTTAKEFGATPEGAKSIVENKPFESSQSQRLPNGWFTEAYEGKFFAIPPAIVKIRMPAQAELRKLSILERAALAGELSTEKIVNQTDATTYIREAKKQGFTTEEINAATPEARAKWNQRFGVAGNARTVAGEVSPPSVDFAAEEAARSGKPKVTSANVLPANKLFGKTAREALQYLADQNLGASELEREGRPLNTSQIMQRAASVIAKLPLKILDADFIRSGKGGNRAYRANEGFIRIPATYRGQTYYEDPTTLVHEVGHTLTADAIRKYVFDRAKMRATGSQYLRALDNSLSDQNTPEQIKKLISLYKKTIDELGLTNDYFGANGLASVDATSSQKRAFSRKKPIINKFTGKKIGWSELYALANLDEFVAQAWSSPAFQDLLKSIKVKNEPSIFEQFVKIIRDLFGFESDTMAAAVIDASFALAELEAPATRGTVEERIAENIAREKGRKTPKAPTPQEPTPAVSETITEPEADTRYNPLGYDIADVVEDIKQGKTDTPLKAVNQVIKESTDLRKRVAAESARRKQPRKMGKAAILERIARERSAGNINENTAKALTDFINRINEDAIWDTAISIRAKGVSNFDFGDNLVTFFLNQDKGDFGASVGIHEFWHGLSRFLPDAEVEKINNDYTKELADYLKKNPWFLAFVGRYSLTPEQFEAYKFFNPKEAETKLTPVKDEQGNIVKYNIKFDKDNYRYIMLDEFIAEKMTDLVLGKQQEPNTFLGKLAKVLREFMALIKARLGIAPYEKFYQAVTSTNGKLVLQRQSGVAPAMQIYDPVEYDYSTRRMELKTQDARFAELEARAKAGDKEAEAEAQRMVDEAAKAAGYAIDSYHGTNGDLFTIFSTEAGGDKTFAESARLGIFSTDNPDVAQIYAENIGVGGTFALGLGQGPLVEAKDRAIATPEFKTLSQAKDAAEKEYSATSKRIYDKYLEVEKAQLQSARGAFRSMLQNKTEAEIDQFIEEVAARNAIREFSADEAVNKNPEITAAQDKINEASKAINEYIYPFLLEALPNVRVMQLKLQIKNPKVYDAKGQTPADFSLSDKIQEAKDLGHDGVIFENIIDPKLPATHYVVFNPEQIKSADPFTYDDAGNLIPLSERFQPSEPDIRRMAVEPEQGNAPIKPEAKTVTEGLVQGIDIGKENNMPINNKIESHIKNFAFVRGIFESASDRLRRAKFTKLATAIDDYYDQAQRRLGFANKILLPAFEEYSKQSKATKKKIDEEVKMFFAAQENKRDTAEFFDELNPITQNIVTAWQKFGEESGKENQRIGIKVYDKGLQRWRPIGRVDKFWPRVLKPEYKRALMEPDKYQKEYNEIVEALMKSGRIETPEEAEVFISEYEGTGSKNDYFSGIETARGQAFPEELYDYSTQVMTDYAARWAQHSSRIEQFGQKLGENSMTLWDKSRASTRDRRTIDYITAAQERVEGYFPNDPFVKGMSAMGIWTSGFQLGNFASSMLNFFGGTTLNAMVGQPGALSSYLSSFVELRKLGRELKDAREKGIVSRDLMNIVGDHQAVLEYNRFAQAGQKTTDFLLKYSGFTPVEQMVRTQSMIIGKSFLRKTLSSLSKNPNSSFSKRSLAWLNRNNIDADKLIVEQGTGPETDKLLRYFANISQGSYTIAQTPIFTDTPIGRFLFKYQKFSTQVMRQSWKNTFEPAWKAVTNKNETLQLPDPTRQLLYRLRLAEAKELGDNRKITLDEIPKKVTKAEGKALTIIPVMMWLGAAYVGGEVILRMRDMLFGVLMKGPSYEDIIKAFEDDEDDDELYLALERAWYNLIGMGALGLIGNYAQFFMDWQDRERVKNPLDPPALSIVKETGTFFQNFVDQGKITVGDINDYLNRTLSAYRVLQRSYQTVASWVGFSKAPTVAEEMFRRETASLNKYARRWAESAGLEYRTRRPSDLPKSKMTPINRKIASYLQRGEPGAAVAYAKEYLNSLPNKERENAIQSMESGARFRQPFRLGNGPMDKSEKKAFTEWLKEKVSKEDFDKFQKLDKGYKKSYDDFLRGLPNK